MNCAQEKTIKMKLKVCALNIKPAAVSFVIKTKHISSGSYYIKCVCKGYCLVICLTETCMTNPLVSSYKTS